MQIGSCNVQCPYFPKPTGEIPWEYDAIFKNIKRRTDGYKFICSYDNHLITSWEDNICPVKKIEGE